MARAIRASEDSSPKVMRVIKSDSRVDRFDASVGESVFDRGEDRGAVFDDAALEFHECGDAALSRPCDQSGLLR